MPPASRLPVLTLLARLPPRGTPACRKSRREEEDEEGDEEWALPEGIEPLLSDLPLYTGALAWLLWGGRWHWQRGASARVHPGRR